VVDDGESEAGEDLDESALPTGAVLAERLQIFECLAACATECAGNSARVSIHRSAGFPVLAIEPSRLGAKGVWVVADNHIDLQVGDTPARWQLSWTDDGIRLVEDIIQAVIAGHGSETFALGRVDVSVQFSDGGYSSALGYARPLAYFLRLPGWRRWGRHVAFVPYRS
jgi:hypothetical protein